MENGPEATHHDKDVFNPEAMRSDATVYICLYEVGKHLIRALFGNNPFESAICLKVANWIEPIPGNWIRPITNSKLLEIRNPF